MGNENSFPCMKKKDPTLGKGPGRRQACLRAVTKSDQGGLGGKIEVFWRKSSQERGERGSHKRESVFIAETQRCPVPDEAALGGGKKVQ